MKLLTKAFAATALTFALTAGAQAQRMSPTVVAVVDTERVVRECNACKVAGTQIQSQVQQLQTLQQQLAAPLQTEQQSLEQAVRALNGKDPDAALKARIQAFQTKQQSANQQLQAREQQIRSTQQNVGQQINAKLQPIIASIMSSRGAQIVLDKGAVMDMAASVDVTNDVLTQLNQQLPSVSVAPLPAQQQQPQGR